MKTLLKGLGFGLGIGLAVYALGLLKDYLEIQEIERERERFGTGD